MTHAPGRMTKSLRVTLVGLEVVDFDQRDTTGLRGVANHRGISTRVKGSDDCGSRSSEGATPESMICCAWLERQLSFEAMSEPLLS